MTRWSPTIKGFCAVLGDEVRVAITPLGMAALSDGEEAHAAPARIPAAVGLRSDPSSRPALTRRQADVLALVQSFYRLHGVPPTVRALCQLLGVRSTGTVYPHLRELHAKGRLRREGHFYVPV